MMSVKNYGVYYVIQHEAVAKISKTSEKILAMHLIPGSYFKANLEIVFSSGQTDFLKLLFPIFVLGSL